MTSVAKEVVQSELRDLASGLPLEHCDYAFAYGSGVIPQHGQQAKMDTNMADFMLVVPDAKVFHRENLVRNASHYSGLRYVMGPGQMAVYQNNWAAGVWFNTLVWIRERAGGRRDRQIKYGVIQTDVAMNDLLDWNHMYLAGRLHKPVLHVLPLPHTEVASERSYDDFMSGRSHNSLAQAIEQNLYSALHCALLQLPATFSRAQLYTTIAGLSYAGDFRMTIGEDKNKVSNIVRGSFDAFDRLYSPLLANIDQVYVSEGQHLVHDVSPAAFAHHLNLLPRTLLWNMHTTWRVQRRLLRYTDLEDVIHEMAHYRKTPAVLRQSLERISRWSSLTQSVKNIPTAGAYKTLLYSSRKLAKWLKSMR